MLTILVMVVSLPRPQLRFVYRRRWLGQWRRVRFAVFSIFDADVSILVTGFARRNTTPQRRGTAVYLPNTRQATS